MKQSKPLSFKRLLLASLVATSAILLGCDSQTPQVKTAPPPVIELSPQGLQKVVNHTVESVVIPNLQAWQSQAEKLSEKSQSFCLSPSEDGLISVQSGFKELSASWNQSVMFDFGPLRDNLFFPKIHFIESMRQRGKDYSKTIQSHFNKRLQDDTTLDEAYFKQLKFTLVGMSAIEVLLFENVKGSEWSSFENRRKCQLLTGLTRLNAKNSDYVVTGWQTQDSALEGEALSYRQQFFTNQLTDGEPALTKLIFALQDYLRYIKQRKLEGKLDAVRSGLTYDNLAQGLLAVGDVFDAKDSGYGLSDYLIKAGKGDVVKRFQAELQQASVAVEQQNIELMTGQYSVLIKMLERDIPQALGVNLGMNFVDGD